MQMVDFAFYISFNRLQQDGKMCVVGPQAALAPPHHLPLFAFGSTDLALRGTQPLPRLRVKVTTGAQSMTDCTKGKATPRRRGRPIEVWGTEQEKEMITERANDAGMSRSAYLRALGMNIRVRSRADLGAIEKLAKINGDLGRISGILKISLADNGAIPRSSFNDLIVEFRRLQCSTTEIMGRILYEKNRTNERYQSPRIYD
ncbi:plasmid mobilization protein [Pseudomonas sp. NEEL19]|uniref:plasmid mobilization protein n=1 Tax=Pseudomonas sp. NEEL19 TaxID=2867409 RepID=UPI002367965F|nr:hypothetical protein [Pseudomonas sp. NEEL19]